MDRCLAIVFEMREYRYRVLPRPVGALVRLLGAVQHERLQEVLEIWGRQVHMTPDLAGTTVALDRAETVDEVCPPDPLAAPRCGAGRTQGCIGRGGGGTPPPPPGRTAYAQQLSP